MIDLARLSAAQHRHAGHIALTSRDIDRHTRAFVQVLRQLKVL